MTGYSALLTEQAWLIRDLLYSHKENVFLRDVGPTREIPRRQDGSILPARVANQNVGVTSSCPLADLAI